MLCSVFEFGSILVTSHLMGQVAKWPCILAKWQGDLSFDRPSGEVTSHLVGLVVGRPLIWWAKWRGVQGVAPISCGITLMHRYLKLGYNSIRGLREGT